MTSIPYDVLMEIMPLVDFRDLTAMARANRSLSGYALDRLYARISSRNMRAACQSVSANPTLAQRVRALHVNRSDHGTQLDSILPALGDALRVTTNLRTLKLDVDGSHSWVLKSGLGAIKLQSFSCFAYTDEDLLNFLHDQTDLEDITLSHSFIERGPPVPWRFLHLRKFDGPMSWIEAVVPGHPVSHLVISHMTNFRPSLASLGLTTVPLLHLQIPLQSLRQIPSPILPVLLPAIESLTLPMDEDVAAIFSTPETPVWLQDVLSSLPTVKDVVILKYQFKDEWERPQGDTTYFVDTATKMAPAICKFTLSYRMRSTPTAMTHQIVSWERGIKGWAATEEDEVFLDSSVF
ncbi:hypothetical protein C8R46DRAFT_1027024 [Mycena filopes]|nr:hypothetical protein C8R46DRAFT_1027024 [Mycena filopes]